MFSFYHFRSFLNNPPISFLPTFLSTPPFVKGIPVLEAMELFKPVIPNNRLREKETPSFLPNPNIIDYLKSFSNSLIFVIITSLILGLISYCEVDFGPHPLVVASGNL